MHDFGTGCAAASGRRRGSRRPPSEGHGSPAHGCVQAAPQANATWAQGTQDEHRDVVAGLGQAAGDKRELQPVPPRASSSRTRPMRTEVRLSQPARTIGHHLGKRIMVATHGSKRRRWWLWVTVGLGVVLLVLAAAGAWLAYTGIKAKNALQSAATALSNAQSALLEGDAAAADQAVTKASTLTGQARRSTSDPVEGCRRGALARCVPKAVTLSSQAADDGCPARYPSSSPRRRRSTSQPSKPPTDGRPPASHPPVSSSLVRRGSLREAQSLMAQVPTSGVPGFVRTGTDELTAKVDEALGVSTTASSLLKVIPGMLGQSGPQTYFVGFQSPVEIRGTGGFPGTYGIPTVDKGKLTQRDTFANTTLVDPVRPSVNLGADYVNLYGADPLWSNMNMSPNFPYAGVQWANGWKVQTGQQVAGAMAIDLTALRT